MPTSDPVGISTDERDARLDQELAGLDALELAGATQRPRARRIWSATWPKLGALAIGLLVWQAVVWSGWKEEYVLPGPVKVWNALWDEASAGLLWTALGTTLRRAVIGFAMALAIGISIGAAVSQIRVLRVAVGSFVTGLQTMPSIAWFPLSLVLFQQTEAAIFFVIILGAAPSVANGLISGIDNLPPLFLRAGRTLGASGFALFRHVILPGALPNFVGGVKQGWAFAWRSLMAGELLVIIANKHSIGSRMEFSRQNFQIAELMSYMVVILVIGIALDALVFGAAERRIQKRWGLLGAERG